MGNTFMTALNIYNVRHLKDIIIPLSKTECKSLILTGKNGSGKTSVLKALGQFSKRQFQIMIMERQKNAGLV